MEMTIHTLVVPTPFYVGPVNAYLILNDPITLFDAGPSTDDALQALCRQMESAGASLKQVRRLIVSHAHEDHAGLVARIKQLNPEVTVYVHAWEARQLAAPFDYMVSGERLRPLGVPAEVIASVEERRKAIRKTLLPMPEVEVLQEGDELPFTAFSLRVLHTPGHTPGHICLWQEQQRALFAADTVLQKITPNPLIAADPRGQSQRFPSLRAYLETLSRLLALAPSLIYPGHGEKVDDLQACCDRALEHIGRRQVRLLELFPAQGATAWAMSRRLYCEDKDPRRYLALSDASAQIDYATAQGKLACELKDGIEYYYPL
jgi:glyoxylase-like metal-dependent hydrolase (beta-lactamase superfamily II)